MFDIIIPHFGVGPATGLARTCSQSIRANSQGYRLIWVDNGGTSELLSELRNHQDLVIIRPPENLGFVKAVNLALRISTAPHVVIMNNDTEAVPGWLDQLKAPLTGQVAMSGPRTNARNSWQGRKVPPVVGPWEILHQKAMLAFFCVMLTRQLLDQVGLLDEAFGVGFGDDDDYCNRTHRAGFRLAWVHSLLIPHHHRTTFKALYSQAEIEAMQNRAMDLVKKKSAP